jgi:hypothetical protein
LRRQRTTTSEEQQVAAALQLRRKISLLQDRSPSIMDQFGGLSGARTIADAAAATNNQSSSENTNDELARSL